MNEVSIRNLVFELEEQVKQMPQAELSLRHYFSPGVYARELTIPEGVVLTGAIHKYAQLNILSKGTMRVTTEDGVVEVSAPYTVVSPPGTKRAAYCLTECVWTTILNTDLTDVAEIENHFIARSESEYLTFKKCHLL